MSQYYLLLGPTLGFVLGIFMAWFLSYSKIKQLELDSQKEIKGLKEELKELSEVEENYQRSTTRLEDSHATIERLQGQLAEIGTELKAQMEQRSALEERIKRIEILEKHIAELKIVEKEKNQLKEKISALESVSSEFKSNHEDLKSEKKELLKEVDGLRKQILELQSSEKNSAVIKERAERLQHENSNLLKENEQLRYMQDQLGHLDEIKQLYSKTVEENNVLKNQDIARHFIEIKDGLEQSIRAYNRMLNMVDKQSLPDNSIIEIEASEKHSTGEKEVENQSSDSENQRSEEEVLSELETDTEDLKNLDGVVEND